MCLDSKHSIYKHSILQSEHSIHRLKKSCPGHSSSKGKAGSGEWAQQLKTLPLAGHPALAGQFITIYVTPPRESPVLL